MDTLIIAAGLVNPPTELLAFRYLTMATKSQLKMTNILEVEPDFKDIYYHYIKEKCVHDYISELITPEENENGVRLDLDYHFPFTVKVNRIEFENVISLLGQIKLLKSF